MITCEINYNTSSNVNAAPSLHQIVTHNAKWLCCIFQSYVGNNNTWSEVTNNNTLCIMYQLRWANIFPYYISAGEITWLKPTNCRASPSHVIVRHQWNCPQILTHKHITWRPSSNSIQAPEHVTVTDTRQNNYIVTWHARDSHVISHLPHILTHIFFTHHIWYGYIFSTNITIYGHHVTWRHVTWPYHIWSVLVPTRIQY